MKKLQLDLVSEFVEKAKTSNGEKTELLKAFRMNVVTSGEIIGSVEVSESGYLCLQMSTGMPVDIIKAVILKLTNGGVIELPDA